MKKLISTTVMLNFPKLYIYLLILGFWGITSPPVNSQAKSKSEIQLHGNQGSLPNCGLPSRCKIAPGFIRGDNPKSKIQNPKSFDFFAEGLIEFYQSNYQAALENFDRATQQQPHNYKIYYYRGLVYALYAQGKPPKPGGMISGCSRVNDYALSCNVAVQIVLVRQNKYQAIQNFNQAIKINPEYAEAYYQRGLVEDNIQHKLDDLHQAIGLYSDEAIADIKKKDYEQAASAFNQEYLLYNVVNSLESIAFLPKQEPETPTSNSVLSKLKSAEELVEQGNSLLSRGDIQAALDKLEQAAALFKSADNIAKYQAIHKIIQQIQRAESQ